MEWIIFKTVWIRVKEQWHQFFVFVFRSCKCFMFFCLSGFVGWTFDDDDDDDTEIRRSIDGRCCFLKKRNECSRMLSPYFYLTTHNNNDYID